MSEVRKLELDNLTVEIEVITDREDNVDLVDCYITITSPSYFEVDDCHVEQSGRNTAIRLSMSHEHTREEEWWERGDLEDHLLRDEGRR